LNKKDNGGFMKKDEIYEELRQVLHVLWLVDIVDGSICPYHRWLFRHFLNDDF